MKKILIYILLITPILIINALSDELILTTELELCSEKNFHNYMEIGDTEVYLCDLNINNAKFGIVVNYFFQDYCPTSYNELSDLALTIGDDLATLCGTDSLKTIKKNIDNYNRVRFYKNSCPSEQFVLLEAGNFQGCLIHGY